MFCSSFWPFTILGFCPVHTRVVTRVGDSKSADKNTTEIGPKEQIPENATSTEMSTVKTTVTTTSEGTTESVMNMTTKLPEDKTTPASSEITTSVSTSPPQDSTTTTIVPTTTQKTEAPEDKATTKATTDETTTKGSKEETTSVTTETPKETTVSEESKDETVSEAPTEDTSPATKAKTDKVKPTETTVKTTAKSTVKIKDSDDDDSDDELTDKKTEASTEGIVESEIESAAEDPKVFYEETRTKPKKAEAPTKASRKTTDKGDARNELNARPTPSTAKQSSRIKGLPSQMKSARQQLAKSNGAVKVSSGASNPAVGDNPINNYYGSSLLRENE
uniref:Uncharacterized protein n=1 Tax=Tetranychus urticae TaxID=32264 RepID=T1KIX6_TETUR